MTSAERSRGQRAVEELPACYRGTSFAKLAHGIADGLHEERDRLGVATSRQLREAKLERERPALNTVGGGTVPGVTTGLAREAASRATPTSGWTKENEPISTTSAPGDGSVEQTVARRGAYRCDDRARECGAAGREEGDSRDAVPSRPAIDGIRSLCSRGNTNCSPSPSPFWTCERRRRHHDGRRQWQSNRDVPHPTSR